MNLVLEEWEHLDDLNFISLKKYLRYFSWTEIFDTWLSQGTLEPIFVVITKHVAFSVLLRGCISYGVVNSREY